jgi:hypothetical protein
MNPGTEPDGNEMVEHRAAKNAQNDPCYDLLYKETAVIL